MKIVGNNVGISTYKLIYLLSWFLLLIYQFLLLLYIFISTFFYHVAQLLFPFIQFLIVTWQPSNKELVLNRKFKLKVVNLMNETHCSFDVWRFLASSDHLSDNASNLTLFCFSSNIYSQEVLLKSFFFRIMIDI